MSSIAIMRTFIALLDGFGAGGGGGVGGVGVGGAFLVPVILVCFGCESIMVGTVAKRKQLPLSIFAFHAIHFGSNSQEEQHDAAGWLRFMYALDVGA